MQTNRIYYIKKLLTGFVPAVKTVSVKQTIERIFDMTNKANFWNSEEVTEETLRKRVHKDLLEILCKHIGGIKDATIKQRNLDALTMYMTIDLGSTPRAAVKQAIIDRVEQLSNA